MAAQILKNVGVWISGQSFAGVSNSVEVTATAETPESTTLESNGWRDFEEGGLKTATFALGGFVDTTDADDDLFASLGDDRSVLVVPAGKLAGDLAYVVPVTASGHSESGSIGDLFGFAYAAQGDGELVRAQVFDVREDVTSDNVTPRVNLGPIATGETLEVWVHVTRRTGRVQISVESATNQTTGAATTRGGAAGIDTTRLEKYSIVGPVTDEWWQLRYDFSVGSPDFDFASAAAIG